MWCVFNSNESVNETLRERERYFVLRVYSYVGTYFLPIPIQIISTLCSRCVALLLRRTLSTNWKSASVPLQAPLLTFCHSKMPNDWCVAAINYELYTAVSSGCSCMIVHSTSFYSYINSSRSALTISRNYFVIIPHFRSFVLGARSPAGVVSPSEEKARLVPRLRAAQ